MVKLTPEQKVYADEHHNLVYAFLKRCGLSVAEHYDIVIFGYLRAVQRYLTDEEIQKYEFSTIAWWAMRSDFTNSVRYYYRKMRFPPPLSLDFGYDDEDGGQPLIASVLEASTTDNLDSKLEWMEVSSVLTDKQCSIVSSRAHGMTDDEIARVHHIPSGKVQAVFDKIRRRVCRQLHYDE